MMPYRSNKQRAFFVSPFHFPKPAIDPVGSPFSGSQPASKNDVALNTIDNPAVWLSRETSPRIRSTALLPSLGKMLAASGLISPDYLADLQQRMCRVADTIAFLMAWQIEESAQLYRRMQAMGPDETAEIITRRCNFDRHHFDAMGDDIESIIVQTKLSTDFISAGSVSA